MIHVLEGFEAEDLGGAALAVFSDQALAELLDKEIFRGTVRIGALRQLQAAHELLERLHLVVLDLIMNVLRCVHAVEDLIEGHLLLFVAIGDHFDCRCCRGSQVIV